jgi:hypothetical protein
MGTTTEWADETWRDLPGWPGCSVSDHGRIRGPRGLRRPQRTPDGYIYVHLYRRGAGQHGSGRSTKVLIHHAVLLAFDAPRPDGHEGRHLDDDASNNHISNLAWGSRRQNVEDKIRNGGHPRGETATGVVLTEAQVAEIRTLHGSASLRELAGRYGVSHTAIRRAALGITWRQCG